ncbi:MAG: hypothetical protein R3F34_18760 [Planctomycetota bacterium]
MTDAYVFVAESFAPVKGLTGFKKGVHGVPQEKSAHGDALVARLAEGELAAEREERASALRSAFGFKRKELEAFGPEDGVMTLATPLFDYEVQVDVDPDDSSWRAHAAPVAARRELEAYRRVGSRPRSVGSSSASSSARAERSTSPRSSTRSRTATTSRSTSTTTPDSRVARSRSAASTRAWR